MSCCGRGEYVGYRPGCRACLCICVSRVSEDIGWHNNLHGDLEEHGVEAAQDESAQDNGGEREHDGLDESKHGVHLDSLWS